MTVALAFNRTEYNRYDCNQGQSRAWIRNDRFDKKRREFSSLFVYLWDYFNFSTIAVQYVGNRETFAARLPSCQRSQQLNPHQQDCYKEMRSVTWTFDTIRFWATQFAALTPPLLHSFDVGSKWGSSGVEKSRKGGGMDCQLWQAVQVGDFDSKRGGFKNWKKGFRRTPNYVTTATPTITEKPLPFVNNSDYYVISHLFEIFN